MQEQKNFLLQQVTPQTYRGVSKHCAVDFYTASLWKESKRQSCLVATCNVCNPGISHKHNQTFIVQTLGEFTQLTLAASMAKHRTLEETRKQRDKYPKDSARA